MFLIQRQLTLPEHTSGFYAITKEVVKALPELQTTTAGLLHLFLQHTSAALTINENADASVLVDLQTSFNSLAPESDSYCHALEGVDDMPGHIKSSLLGVSLTIPVQEGKLALGQWQDIYLCEFRLEPHRRNVLLTLQGSID